MSFSQTAGVAFVPTMSRIVLAMAFITVGYHKLMGQATFSAEEAAVLGTLGVNIEPAPEEGAVADQASASRVIVPARFVPQEDPPPAEEPPAKDPDKEADPDKQAEERETELGEAVDSAGEGAAKAIEDVADETAEVIDETAEKMEEVGQTIDDAVGDDLVETADGQFIGRPLHRITLMCEARGWPNPRMLGWMAGVTEFVGGLLLLVGFLSRLWGLGLAGTMGVAFYLTSLGAYFDAGWVSGPFEVAQGADGYGVFNRVFVQLSLMVLALGVFVTGPGPISLDRVLFGRRGKDQMTGEDEPVRSRKAPEGTDGPSPRPL